MNGKRRFWSPAIPSRRSSCASRVSPNSSTCGAIPSKFSAGCSNSLGWEINMRPDFANIEFQPRTAEPGAEATEGWLTLEHIAVKNFYNAGDLAGLEHLDYAAGVPPYLRGPYSTMYVMQPW